MSYLLETLLYKNDIVIKVITNNFVNQRNKYTLQNHNLYKILLINNKN